MDADGHRSLRNHTFWSAPLADEARNPRKSSHISVHPVRQAKPGFSIVLKREQHVK
jgi:hypothetical protein